MLLLQQVFVMLSLCGTFMLKNSNSIWCAIVSTKGIWYATAAGAYLATVTTTCI